MYIPRPLPRRSAPNERCWRSFKAMTDSFFVLVLWCLQYFEALPCLFCLGSEALRFGFVFAVCLLVKSAVLCYFAGLLQRCLCLKKSCWIHFAFWLSPHLPCRAAFCGHFGAPPSPSKFSLCSQGESLCSRPAGFRKYEGFTKIIHSDPIRRSIE